MGERVMKRVIQPGLKRGRVADRAAMLLLLTLLAILVIAVIRGVGTLAS
jgi:hypothetical protein